MAVQELSKEVLAFVESYMRVFDTFDSVRIAAFYHIPCVTARADGSVHYLPNEEDLRSFFQKVVDTYQQEGWRRFRFRDLEVTAIGARSALASLDWEMLRGDGTLVRRRRHSYNLLRSDTEWKILASTIHHG